MNMNRRFLVLLLMMFSALPAAVSATEEKGWFGLAFSAETQGTFFNPTIQSVKIASVAPASPGAGAGLTAGDLVLSLQGIVVAGAKADELKLAMKKSVGETLRLEIKRGAAEPFEVRLIAIAKPADR